MDIHFLKLDSSILTTRCAMTELIIQFGLNLRAKRKALNITQDNLALMADLDRSYVGRIERGESNITLDVLYKLATALHCEPSELLPKQQPTA